MNKTTKSKKIETSKLLLYISYAIAIILTVLVIVCTFLNIDCSNIVAIIGYSYGEVAAVNAFYLNMNKRINAPKVVMGLYSDLPDNLKEQVDVNNLLSNILN